MAKVKEVKTERKEKKNRYKNPPINIIKKNGTKQPFDGEKIRSAIEKSAERVMVDLTDEAKEYFDQTYINGTPLKDVLLIGKIQTDGRKCEKQHIKHRAAGSKRRLDFLFQIPAPLFGRKYTA